MKTVTVKKNALMIKVLENRQKHVEEYRELKAAALVMREQLSLQKFEKFEDYPEENGRKTGD